MFIENKRIISVFNFICDSSLKFDFRPFQIIKNVPVMKLVKICPGVKFCLLWGDLFCAALFFAVWLILYDFEFMKMQHKPPLLELQFREKK